MSRVVISEQTQQRYSARLLIYLCVAAYFMFWAHAGLRAYFNPDDTYNMYHAWVEPAPKLIRSAFFFWSGAVRPLGFAFYKLVYWQFGFTPSPFRVLCFVVIFVNIALQYRLYLLLSESSLFTFPALLLGCFHGGLWSIYASTGTVFDVLSQFFVLLTVTTYIDIRQKAGKPNLAQTIVLAALTAASIESKEMGFAVPLLLSAYELVFRWPAGLELRQMAKSFVIPARVIGATSLVAAIAWLGLAFGHNGLHYQMASYTPVFTLDQYLATTNQYLDMLFFKAVHTSGYQGVTILAGFLLLALLLRSRLMLFGWLFYIVSLLPMSFVTLRYDGYVLYIPYTGCAIYAAGLFDRLVSRAGAFIESRLPSGKAVNTLFKYHVLAIYVLVCILVHSYQARHAIEKGFGPGGQELIRSLTAYAAAAKLPAKGRVLVIKDPFDDNEWQPLYVFTLSHRNPDLKISRVASAPAHIEKGAYDNVVIYDRGRYSEYRNE